MALCIPPVLVVFISALLIWAVARYVQFPSYTVPGTELIALLLLALGVAVSVLGVVSFRRASTTPNPMHPERASTLVTNGIYRYTRNPMYLGFALALLGWVVYLSAWPALLVVAAYVGYMSRSQIQPEENALATRFGAAFTEYKNKVRRWL